MWEHILDHRKRPTHTGEINAGRGEQQVKWMWTMLEERLFVPLRSDRIIKAFVSSIEADVVSGVTAPAAAVEKSPQC